MFFKIIITLLTLNLLIMQTPTSDGAKILSVVTYPGKSHYQMTGVVIKELLKHGHEVTMITALTLEPQKLGKNYTEILIEPEFDIWKRIYEETGKKSMSECIHDVSFLMHVFEIVGMGTAEHTLQQPKVQAIINAKQTKGVYDVLLVNQFVQDAFLALAHVYDVPVISLSTFAHQNHMSQMFGLISPWSYVPFGFTTLTDRMSFWERVQNTYYSLKIDFDKEFNYYPKMDALVKKYFGHLTIDFPSTSAMSRNLSAMFMNNHAPLAFPGPKMNNIIDIGGVHIYPNKSLPGDMQTFLDGAEHGVIYFSLGSQVQSKDLPPEKIQIFLDVFRNLKQHVLWKYENVSLEDVPKNVMIKAWMPQNDVLAHPNVRVFISHGGLFGTQEAVYHGVPVVGIPFHADQYLNVRQGELAGYAIPLNKERLTRDSLNNALNEVLYNANYRNTMKRMSKIFRDRPMGPRETAMYWIDYVIRHKGARHLRAAGLDLKWYQFYLIDVIALFVAAVATIIGIICSLVFWIWRKAKSGKEKRKVQ